MLAKGDINLGIAEQTRCSLLTGLCDTINLCDKNQVVRKQCYNQRAQCLETDDDKGYRCQCPEGQALYSEKCRDLCDIRLN